MNVGKEGGYPPSLRSNWVVFFFCLRTFSEETTSFSRNVVLNSFLDVACGGTPAFLLSGHAEKLCMLVLFRVDRFTTTQQKKRGWTCTEGLKQGTRHTVHSIQPLAWVGSSWKHCFRVAPSVSLRVLPQSTRVPTVSQLRFDKSSV